MHKTILLVAALALFASLACHKDGGTQTENAPAQEAAASAADAAPATPPPTEPAPENPPPPVEPPPTEPAPAADAAPATPAPVEPVPAADAAPAAPAIDAAALVASRCSSCHSADKVLRQSSRDRQWWTTIVGRMVRNGARLDDAEKQALIDYLVNRPAN